MPSITNRSNTISRTTDAPQEERKFRPDIEGLRTIAVLLVVLDHAGWTVLSGGFIGVDVFFVLSGFLITGLLLREIETTGRISIIAFYARRARRLLPAATLVLFATVIGSYLWLGASVANRTATDGIWAALFASNIRFINLSTDYLDAQVPPSAVQQFWSLAVEEQFYAVWPAAILLIGLVGRRFPIRARLNVVLIAIITASLLWSIHLTAVDGSAAYFSPLTRACELGAGGLLAVHAPRLRTLPKAFGSALSWAGLGLIFVAAVVIDGSTRFPGYMVALPVVATGAVVVGGTITPGIGAERLLRLSPFQYLGHLSYSLYLWHWPVLIIAAGRAGRDLTLRENLGLCLGALGLSIITYRLLENPVRDSSFLKTRPAYLSVGMGAVLVVLLVGFSWWQVDANQQASASQVNQTDIASLPTSEQVIAAVREGVNVETWPKQPPRIVNPARTKECDATRMDTTSSMCVHGDPNGAKSMIVYGDSHAAMWIPALDVIGKAEGWRVIQLVKPGCQVSDFPRYSTALKREYTECEIFRTFALEQIQAIGPDMVVMASAYKDVRRWVDGGPTDEGIEQAWEDGLTSMLQRIALSTDRMVVIGDMAYPNEPGIDCLTAHTDDVGACNTPREDGVFEEHNDREREVATTNGAEFIDVTDWFCTESVCPAVVGGLTTHRDSYHVAENYVAWLSRALEERLALR